MSYMTMSSMVGSLEKQSLESSALESPEFAHVILVSSMRFHRSCLNDSRAAVAFGKRWQQDTWLAGDVSNAVSPL